MLVQKVSLNQCVSQNSNNRVGSCPMTFGKKVQGVNSALDGLVNTPFIKPFARNLSSILSPEQFRAFIDKARDLAPKFLSIRGYEGSRQMFIISPIERTTRGAKPYTVYKTAVRARNVDRGYTAGECDFELNHGIFQSRLSSGKNIAKKLLEACKIAAI